MKSTVLKSVLVIFFAANCVIHFAPCIGQIPGNKDYPVYIWRRISTADIVEFSLNGRRETCPKDTYLVAENSCVDNDDLIKGRAEHVFMPVVCMQTKVETVFFLHNIQSVDLH